MKTITAYLLLLTGVVSSALSGLSGCTQVANGPEPSGTSAAATDTEIQKPKEGELYTPANSRHFQKYTDPQTGAVSYMQSRQARRQRTQAPMRL